VTHRFKICKLLKKLWDMPTHRTAFVGAFALLLRLCSPRPPPAAAAAPPPLRILLPVMRACWLRACVRLHVRCVCGFAASCDHSEIANDRDKFVKFVNGILNETNSLITDALSKLHDIREMEVAMVRACVRVCVVFAVFISTG
jgi:hypothetical protein